MDHLNITVQFGGGTQNLFNNKKFHNVTLPPRDEKWKLGDLVIWLKDNLLTERPELFLQDNNIRPGILVAVNDVDWELLNTTHYVLQPNDRVLFLSTLHGG